MFRRLLLCLLLFVTLAASPGVVVTFTPTGGTLVHNYTTLSGGVSPGAIGYNYGIVYAYPSWASKTTSTYFSTPAFSPNSFVQITAPYYEGVATDNTGIQPVGTVAIYGIQGANATAGSSFSIDLGKTGSGNTGLSANTTYTVNVFMANYCMNLNWSVSADDGSFTTVNGTFNQPYFQLGYATASFQFTTAGTNSGATFTATSVGAACDGGNAYYGLQGYTLNTGALPNPDGTPPPTPTPSPSPSPTPTPNPSTSPPAGTPTPIPGGAQYRGQVYAYGKQPGQVPLTSQGQPGQTADLLDIVPQPAMSPQVWIDSNAIIHTNGGTSLLAYNSSGQLVGTPHIVLLAVTTPNTSQTGCGPYYQTGSYYCATVVLPTGLAAFTSAATFGINGVAVNTGTGIYYSPLGGNLFSVNWSTVATLYVPSSSAAQTYLLMLFGY